MSHNTSQGPAELPAAGVINKPRNKHAYERLIERHPLSQKPYRNCAITKGEVAHILIADAVSCIQTTKAHANKTANELVRSELISDFIDNLDWFIFDPAVIPVVGRPRPVGPGRALHLQAGPFFVSGLHPGIHDSINPPADTLSIPYIIENVTSYLKEYGIEEPHITMLNLKTAEIMAPDGPGGRATIALNLIPHEDRKRLNTVIDSLATEILMRTLKHKAIAEKIAFIRKEAAVLAGPGTSVLGIRINGTNAAGIAFGTPVLGNMVFALTVLAQNEFLIPQETTHHVHSFLDDDPHCWGTLAEMGTRMRKRVKKKTIAIDAVSARYLLENPDIAQDLVRLVREGDPLKLHDLKPKAFIEARDGVISAAVKMGPSNVQCYHGKLTIASVELPDTILASLKGLPVSKLIDHPWLGNTPIRYAKNDGGQVVVMLQMDEIPFGDFIALLEMCPTTLPAPLQSTKVIQYDRPL